MKTPRPTPLLLLLLFVLSSCAKIDPGYRGRWKLVGYIDEHGERHAPSEAHVLLLTDSRMIRYDMDGATELSAPHRVTISSSGAMAAFVPETGEETDLGLAEIRNHELHLVAAGGEDHLIYQRTTGNRVEQEPGAHRLGAESTD